MEVKRIAGNHRAVSGQRYRAGAGDYSLVYQGDERIKRTDGLSVLFCYAISDFLKYVPSVVIKTGKNAYEAPPKFRGVIMH